MKSEAKTFESKQIWLLGIIVSALASLPLSFFVHRFPWLIAIPIIFGTGLVLYFAICNDLKSGQVQLPLLKMPPHFYGLGRYKGYAAIALVESGGEQKFFEFLNSPRNKTKFPAILKDEHGNDVVAIDAEQFTSMLIARVAASTDKVTEATMKIAVHRYGEMNRVSDELECFLRDKTVLDVIKMDFRANSTVNLTRSSEFVIRDLIKRTKDSKGGIPLGEKKSRPIKSSPL